MKNKVAMITGGRGFIGSSLANILGKDNEIIIYDIVDGNDVRDIKVLRAMMKNVDYVFHFAAIASVEESINKPKETMDHNILGTYNVLKAAIDNNVKRVLFSSSAAVYGDINQVPIKEDFKLNATSPYAISKIVSENLLDKFKVEHNLNSIYLRYFNVYGPNQNIKYSPVIPVFIRKALNNENITIYGDGKQTRDFIYIGDVNRANIIAMETEASGVFNIGSGKSINIENLAKLIIKLTGSESKIVYEEPREGDIIDSVANIEKANKILGFEPKYSLEEGVKETISWFKNSY